LRAVFIVIGIIMVLVLIGCTGATASDTVTLESVSAKVDQIIAKMRTEVGRGVLQVSSYKDIAFSIYDGPSSDEFMHVTITLSAAELKSDSTVGIATWFNDPSDPVTKLGIYRKIWGLPTITNPTNPSFVLHDETATIDFIAAPHPSKEASWKIVIVKPTDYGYPLKIYYNYTITYLGK
jgi:hypothetical protein